MFKIYFILKVLWEQLKSGSQTVLWPAEVLALVNQNFWKGTFFGTKSPLAEIHCWNLSSGSVDFIWCWWILSGSSERQTEASVTGNLHSPSPCSSRRRDDCMWDNWSGVCREEEGEEGEEEVMVCLICWALPMYELSATESTESTSWWHRRELKLWHSQIFYICGCLRISCQNEIKWTMWRISQLNQTACVQSNTQQQKMESVTCMLQVGKGLSLASIL